LELVYFVDLRGLDLDEVARVIRRPGAVMVDTGRALAKTRPNVVSETPDRRFVSQIAPTRISG
jgi:hypothetical protein